MRFSLWVHCVLQLGLFRSQCNDCVNVAACHGCLRNTIVSFAAGPHKSYWSGSIEVEIMRSEQISPIVALLIFLSNSFSKQLRNQFLAAAPRSGFRRHAVSDAVAHGSIVFCS